MKVVDCKYPCMRQFLSKYFALHNVLRWAGKSVARVLTW